MIRVTLSSVYCNINKLNKKSVIKSQITPLNTKRILKILRFSKFIFIRFVMVKFIIKFLLFNVKIIKIFWENTNFRCKIILGVYLNGYYPLYNFTMYVNINKLINFHKNTENENTTIHRKRI